MSKIHELKTAPKFFDDVAKGLKTFEVRKNDRDFKKNDILHLRKYSVEADYYYSEFVLCRVTYVLKGGKFGIAEDHCVMGIKVLR